VLVQAFVLFITICREAFDDFMRFLRDKEINNQKYIRLSAKGQHPITSAEIEVGDVIIVGKVRQP
jgi:phospholipid-translocating ATPase